jgi:hypothetical protein
VSEPTKTTDPTPSADRDESGRFMKGNRGGPGNPFARKTAALRAALLRMVTEQDIMEIACRLVMDAKVGDKAATKLLFQYVIGKPQPAINPDTLDVDEFKNLQAEAACGDAVPNVMEQPALPFWLEVLPHVTDSVTRRVAGEIGDMCAQADEKDKRRAECAARKAERKRRRAERRQMAAAGPSPNGNNGHAAGAAAHGPSTNGEIGGSALFDAFTDWLRERRDGLDG